MSHTHLTLEERISIEIFVSMGLSCREIWPDAWAGVTARFPGSCAATWVLQKEAIVRRAACPQKAKESKALPLYESARTGCLGR